MYDVIVIGARCAGSPTAMLLARKGYKVLLVDKVAFPSDTISTHIIWPPGASRLKHWGLLDTILSSNCPKISKVTLDLGPFALTGSPLFSEVVEVIAPRRTVLDKILADAAVNAGAELRENCVVEEIIMDENRVTGIRCRNKGGSLVRENARMVIGADGKNSIVARTVDAQEYNSRQPLTCWYYTYWSGMPVEDIVLYSVPNRAIGAIPTNDGLTCLPVAWPANEFHDYRSDIEGNYMKTLELNKSLAELVRQGKREERFFGMADLRNFFRKSSGPGWALVGDAGYHKDPITAQGISDAIHAAEMLTDALDAGFSGKETLEKALEHYELTRDEEVMPMYEFTCDWATLQPPPPDMEYLFTALRENQVETNRFIGTLAGTVPIPEFFSPENIQRITGTMETGSNIT
ncbi:NAD(P)/FAD-dependent oxidoreductase [Chitinophagaceae bacterium LB-8]|uniref:NAD(P)/FAD-dependent oxidoreductase n=1 Tax=Paraflavisolibacter caeni TaxID=2982496 RepID=A0A9X3BHW5_9BACT|nr:NAD(P)/FAD-dependent oxidoreductase [Paraflavisolibacter caeni]MCU7549278.1 NAD(P)/FAD-dependent oxidoreductase [Paraflavisolibacter caeni]